MVIIYGWIEIRESFEMFQSEFYSIKNIKIEIEKLIDKYEWNRNEGVGNVALEFQNGALALTVSMHANRVRSETEDIFQLYRYISKIAKGSFGILYFHNDEDEKYNEFQVFVLKKGKLEEVKDIHFSPIIPKVELDIVE